jgi:23S rRNA pseudouridine2605 synthase
MPGTNKSSRKGRGTSFGKQSGAEKSFYKKKKTDRSDDSKPRKSWNATGAPTGFRKGPGASFNRAGGGSKPRFTKSEDSRDKPRFGKSGGTSNYSSRSRSDSADESKPRRSYGSSEGKSPRPWDNKRGGTAKPSGFSKPRTSRFGSSEDKPSRPWDNKRSSSDKPTGFSKPRTSRFGSSEDKPSRPWGNKPGGTDKPSGFSKPRTSRFGASGDKPSRPWDKKTRGDQSEDRRPPRKTNEDKASGFSKPPREEREPRERKSFIQSRVVRSGDFVKNLSGGAVPGPEKDGLTRLNKFVANAGVGSRRQADELIKMGLISVNGVTITELGTKVKHGDVVRYEDRVLKAEQLVYVLLNKPKGFITTTEDPQERNTVMGLVAGACKERIYPVGRLDRNTTGLLLLTNDGDLADKLTHPSYKAKKVYKVELSTPLTKNDLKAIAEGVVLEEGRAMVDDVAILSDDNKSVGLEIHIGWNRVVRRIFESLGYEVVKLDRSVFAGLDKKDIGRGQWRFLKPEEVIRLKHFK